MYACMYISLKQCRTGASERKYDAHLTASAVVFNTDDVTELARTRQAQNDENLSYKAYKPSSRPVSVSFMSRVRRATTSGDVITTSSHVAINSPDVEITNFIAILESQTPHSLLACPKDSYYVVPINAVSDNFADSGLLTQSTRICYWLIVTQRYALIGCRNAAQNRCSRSQLSNKIKHHGTQSVNSLI